MRGVIVAHLIIQIIIIGVAIGSALASVASRWEAAMMVGLSIGGAICTWQASSTLRLLEPSRAD